LTLPVIGEWTGAETKASQSPIFCPASTEFPFLTKGSQTEPICWLSITATPRIETLRTWLASSHRPNAEIFYTTGTPSTFTTPDLGSLTWISLGALDTTSALSGNVNTFTAVNARYFQIQVNAPLEGNNKGEINEVAFNVSPVPEPVTLALLGLGGVVVAIRRRH
jgi:hypothetical protein